MDIITIITLEFLADLHTLLNANIREDTLLHTVRVKFSADPPKANSH